MIFGLHTWKIKDTKEQVQFSKDWKRVTTEIARPAGNRFARLFKIYFIYISITIWNSNEEWNKWKNELRNIPERELYRQYKLLKSYTVQIGK